MDSRSVLADRFVPHALQNVNFAKPTQVWPAVNLPVLEHELATIFFQSVPPPLLNCSCGRNGTNDSVVAAAARATPQQHSWKYPLRVLHPELNFASERRREQLKSVLTPPTPTIPMKDGAQDSWNDDQAGDLVLPAVEDIKDPAMYRATFEAILAAERKEVLILYERHSQYDLHITTTHKPKYKVHYDGPPAEVADSASRFKVIIPGIADAHPPLQAGDFLLLRNVKKVSLPQNENPPKGVLRWNQAIHLIEIISRVTNIVVDKSPKVMGGIEGTWMPNFQAAVLDHTYPEAKYNLRVIPNTTTAQRCLTALDWLATIPSDMVMRMLFPDQAPRLLSLGVNNSDDDNNNDRSGGATADLNDKQSAFCQMVLARTRSPATDQVRGPMVLTGPAGTGKTKTLLASIQLVLNSNGTGTGTTDSSKEQYRILVCTPSHTACDVVCRRLGQFMDKTKLFRLFDADRPIATVPVKILGFCRQSGSTGTFSVPPAKELLSFQVIVCTCSDAHLLYMAGLTNQQLRCRRRCFQQSLEMACQDRHLSVTVEGVNEPHFTHLFIDEAAQATEPETLIPFSVVVDPYPGIRNVEIVLSGDPRQLQPAVYSSTAAAAGLNRSLMERLLQRPVRCLGDGNENMLGPNLVQMEDWLQYSFERDGQEQLSIFLTTNYRGHASFLMMPSALFYGDRLLSAGTDKDQVDGPTYWCEKLRVVEQLSQPASVSITHATNTQSLPDALEVRKQLSWPMHFRGVVGKDASVTIESFAGGNSWSNLKEAEAVTDIVIALTEQGVSSQSIGVMAPFRGQVVLIRKLLRLKSLGGVDVGTVENYQAVERDVIVLSMTRSTHAFVESDMERRMGLFGQAKRSNVALTRAEHLLIVVGDPNTMAKDFVWRQFLWFCLRNGLWYGETGATESTFHWGSSHRIARHRPRFESEETSTSPAEEGKPQVVTVSTLERLLRE
jgi:hypothetical protein